MKVTLTILSENTAAPIPGLLAEWGLSILIETDEGHILFDTGQTISASHNAEILGVDLSQVDRIVLSHGHFDHAGGLGYILPKIGRATEVIAHPDIWATKYNRDQSGDLYIGIPYTRHELESQGAIFNLSTKPVKIGNNIMTTGEIPMTNDFERIDPELFVKLNTGWQPDEVRDDLALIIHAGRGLVVILGCAHRGIINTLHYAQRLTGVEVIHTVIGGCHLFRASEEYIMRIIYALKQFGVKRLGVCHCTGFLAARLMAQEFGDNFLLCNSGTRWSI